ncbi:glycosyl hydrolase 115 family protein [Pseudoduganella sp. RAF19]|uniref:glycosyl hydrolase 115 family protein n=3 Tax=unclassified Pseudoduganella TaxID=2637179 RepID=UPI003F9EA704
MTARCSSLRANKGWLAAALLWVACAIPARAADWIHTTAQAHDFALDGAPVVYSPADAPVVGIAARDLTADVERVTGRKPAWSTSAPRGATAILVGTLGKSALIDKLAASGKLDASRLRGAWESFVITTVDAPMPGLRRALVIAGSDPRGTAYGVYELSEAMGVSPWHWWADVPVTRQRQLYVAAGTRRFGPPSVKYRGIFINDEDWGMQPWAAHAFEPGSGGIGPRTYGRIFELLLRLNANMLWPAMHPGTPPFNADPRNAALADRYSIVMGSSHAEPMLRNNVGEWKAPAADYNYLSNGPGVLRYWEERMVSNGRYENIYTLGMRGIHDSSVQGAKTDAERVALLQKIFTDQRGLLKRYALPDAPQMFCAYKEVLPLYRQGLQVPDDVTIVWPDDNFGYIRNFTDAQERARGGGFGIYYHLSYLGAPLSYLWLYTTPPALVWEEMSRAYAHGADRMWIANVGDLKPAEIGTEFFLRLAWNVDAWGADAQPVFLQEWAQREFGAALGPEIAGIMGEYYRLNFRRRPEHLQWWLPKEARKPNDLPSGEVDVRLADFAALRLRVEGLRAALPSAAADAFFELVEYPVLVSALSNERFFEGERGRADVALAADAALERLNVRWNRLAGGKWRGMMSAEPADAQWQSMRIAKWTLPASDAGRVPAAGVSGASMRFAADAFLRRADGEGVAWGRVQGLGKTGGAAVAILRSDAAHAAEANARLEYEADLPAGEVEVRIHMLPTFPAAGQMRVGVAMDGQQPQFVGVEAPDGGAAWTQGVLNNDRVASVKLHIAAAGRHTISVCGADVGLVIDSLEFVPARNDAHGPER